MKKISRVINAAGDSQEIKRKAVSPLPINDDLADDIINVMPNMMAKISNIQASRPTIPVNSTCNIGIIKRSVIQHYVPTISDQELFSTTRNNMNDILNFLDDVNNQRSIFGVEYEKLQLTRFCKLFIELEPSMKLAVLDKLNEEQKDKLIESFTKHAINNNVENIEEVIGEERFTKMFIKHFGSE